MDLNAIATSVSEFFATTAGQVVANILKVFYAISSPSNAPAATLPAE